ncbi:hypothetical protein MJ1_0426 [Nanobdella aerobiophila]|uniref:Uncharacterized protein n=1 Tax=Nanobdella aerobiophila TaxID=2586965 RepID=A0A915WRG2_9ARCH|nr:hypothetical protein [Nanobdella aerobiophila]BBL45588.1 hypothetical protein MJ1_0426 [Nanobdella aerobiophila]
MNELLHIEQDKDFPDKFYGIITSIKDNNNINFLDYENNIYSYINNKMRFPFYFGIIPQTYIEDGPLSFIFFSENQYSILTKIKLEPSFFIKVPTGEAVLNIVFSEVNSKIIINKDNIKNILEEFFNEEISIINNAKNILINANNEYHRKYVKIIKKL